MENNIELNEICKNYVNMIKNNFGNLVISIIFYGSNIYIKNCSDLDVCIIIKLYSKEIEKEIIEKTILFHKNFNLKIDEEIPFTNKLLYTIEEIKEILLHPPFYIDSKTIIRDIIKSKEFLESKEMKQRLLLNILTTDHITIGESTLIFEKKAMRIMINVIIKYYNLKHPNTQDILNHLYVNPITKSSGEMYLGYKDNHPNKKKYLINKIKDIINNEI